MSLLSWLSARGVGTWLRRMAGVRLGRFAQYPPRPLALPSGPPPGDDARLPSIVLVTPSFNQAAFIGATLASVLRQGYPDLRYVVQDACSSDGSAEILAAHAGQGVEVVTERDAGQADAINRGFARASGEVMGWLNADDLLAPGSLHRVGRYFRDHPEVDVVYGNRLIVDEQGREIGRWLLPGHDGELLRHVDYVPQESLFWRRRIWERAGGKVDGNLHFALDWDLLLRFAAAGAVVRHLPELFGIFRCHEAQKTRKDFAVVGLAEMARLRQRYGGSAIPLPRRLWRHMRYLAQHRKIEDFHQRHGPGPAALP